MRDGPRISAIENGGRELRVRWSDGRESRFHALWLRHGCECASCGSTRTAVRRLRLTDLDENLTIGAVAHEADAVELRWPDGHRSRFAATWLRANCYSAPARRERRHRPLLWGPELLQRFPRLRYPEANADERLRLRLLEQLRDLGVVLLEDVPAESERTAEVAGLVGRLHLSNYGIYELQSKPNPEIAGDTGMALMPHTDEPYRLHPPGITFFHVLAQSAQGGESTLVDGFRVAQVLREREPQAFEALCTLRLRFHRELAEGRHFECRAPVFTLDEAGEVCGVRLLDRGLAPLDVPESSIERAYSALRALLRLVYDPAQWLQIKLSPGEILVFNNQRLLHGRTAFDPASSVRHVRSCHVDLDEFYSSLRVLGARFGEAGGHLDFAPGSHP